MLAMVVGVFRLGRNSCAELVRERRNTTNRAATSRHRIEMWRIAPLSAAKRLSVEGFASRPRGRPQEYTALDEVRARAEERMSYTSSKTSTSASEHAAQFETRAFTLLEQPGIEIRVLVHVVAVRQL